MIYTPGIPVGVKHPSVGFYNFSRLQSFYLLSRQLQGRITPFTLQMNLPRFQGFAGEACTFLVRALAGVSLKWMRRLYLCCRSGLRSFNGCIDMSSVAFGINGVCRESKLTRGVVLHEWAGYELLRTTFQVLGTLKSIPLDWSIPLNDLHYMSICRHHSQQKTIW